MRLTKFKFILLFGLMLSAAWSNAFGSNVTDGHSHINIKESIVQGMPKGSSILASIDGHTLTVIFTENLGQVTIEITTATGTHVDCMSLTTPDGFQFVIPNSGDYVITFTLPNGDEYYGEFTVTN